MPRITTRGASPRDEVVRARSKSSTKIYKGTERARARARVFPLLSSGSWLAVSNIMTITRIRELPDGEELVSFEGALEVQIWDDPRRAAIERRRRSDDPVEEPAPARGTVPHATSIVVGLAALAMTALPASMAAAASAVSAQLVDPVAKAAKKEATVVVTVSDVKMVDPGDAKEQPKSGEGHLHYRLDDGPVIATTATKLSFHELSTGQHKIVVQLAASNHEPVGDPAMLDVTVP